MRCSGQFTTLTPGEVARSDHHVVALRGGRHRRKVLGIVREVGVHLKDQVRARLERLAQAVDVRAAKPSRSVAMHDLDAAGILPCQIVGDRARPVGRSVVDHEHAKARMSEDPRRQNRQVVLLVVGRRHDDDVAQVLSWQNGRT